MHKPNLPLSVFRVVVGHSSERHTESYAHSEPARGKNAWTQPSNAVFCCPFCTWSYAHYGCYGKGIILENIFLCRCVYTAAEIWNFGHEDNSMAAPYSCLQRTEEAVIKHHGLQILFVLTRSTCIACRRHFQFHPLVSASLMGHLRIAASCTLFQTTGASRYDLHNGARACVLECVELGTRHDSRLEFRWSFNEYSSWWR